MFKKPLASIKPYSPLRSSDRRKFREELIRRYPTLENGESEENKSIVPEHVEKANVKTHNGYTGVLYVDESKHPLWIRLDKDKNEFLVPSVYTLWRNPSILPKIPTFPAVISKLENGANLMIPGIAFPTESLPDVKEGELVSIIIRDYNAPLAVGIMDVPTNSLERGSTRKGVAVSIIHIYKDQLWSMGDKSSPPDMEEGVKIDSIVEKQIKDEEHEQDEGQEREQRSATEVDTDFIISNEEEEAAIEQTARYTTAEVDDLLQASLYQALTEKLTSSVLPITSSQLYSEYILPSRPIGTEKDVDVKKSSYKQAMEKKGVIKLKSQRGETFLIRVDRDNEELKNFRSHKTVEKAAKPHALDEENKLSNSNNTASEIQIAEVYKPKGAVAELFEIQGKSKEGIYDFREIRQTVLGYVNSRDLADKRNRRYITLDENLREVLADKKFEDPLPDKMTQDDLFQHIRERMEEYHSVTFPGNDPELRKGSPKHLQILEATRSGNKMVTIIRGLEDYGINPDDLVEPLKKLCASSVTVSTTPQSSPKKPLYEVTIQGPQTTSVKEYLINTKGIPKKYITATPAKKGKGNKGGK
ncbi:330_t:CDS:10 [Acaulospora colombiana]|uniref:330_t:CDS:1 n=1 Tax=Acaulospora colombiana TaxID=27376 RepID=A0ACA9KZ37_9GLOM|nr:330_t:CDS:10 [Acaulospora colombiana]